MFIIRGRSLFLCSEMSVGLQREFFRGVFVNGDLLSHVSKGKEQQLSVVERPTWV